MSVGLQNFVIKLDRQNKIFSPGETIVGQVIVQLGRPKTARGIKIRFKGKGKVSFKIGKHSHQDTEEYFRMQYYLIGDSVGEEIEIVSGCHIFPFNFVLPPDIPSSFETKHGHIRYAIKAIIDRAWKIDDETTQTFFVGTPNYDITQIAAAMIPQNRDVFQSFCCFPFCCETGSMDVNINIPKSAYTAGEIITVKVSLNNNSTTSDVTQVTLCIKQIITLFAGSEKCRETNYIGHVSDSGPFHKRDEVMVRMQVPMVPPSSFPHSKLFDISYHLKVKVLTNGCCANTKQTFPIVIGTMPIVNTQPVRRPSMTPALPSIEPTEPSAPENPIESFSQPNFVDLSPVPATTSNRETQPPSYDDCMKMATKE